MNKKDKKNHLKKIGIGVISFLLYFFFGLLGMPTKEELGDFAGIVNGYYIIGILFIIILTFIYSKALKEDWKIFKEKGTKNISYSFFVFLGSLTIIILLKMLINYFAYGDSLVQSSNMIFETFNSYPFYVLFVTIFYTPYVEEILFRMTLGDIFKNKVFYILISSIAFGLLHGEGNILNFDNIISSIPLIILGASMAIAYIKSKTVFVPILIHLFYNVIITVLSY